MIDDFDAVLPPADADAEDDDRSRNQPPRDPEEDAEWRSEFPLVPGRSRTSRLSRWWLRVTIGIWLHRA